MIHINDIINGYIAENRISKSALARELGFTRNNLGQRLKNRNMSVSFVQKLSDTLGHNFFEYLVDQTEKEKISQLELEITILKREKEMLSSLIRERI